MRHAHASEVQISLQISDDEFMLAIEDNGCGFLLESEDKNQPAQSSRLLGGNGLNNIRQRLAHIGGRCRILSTPGHGTRVQFDLGVKASPAIVRMHDSPPSLNDVTKGLL